MQETESELAPKRPAKVSSIESQRALAQEYELELKKKHEHTYTPFQYKLWAEMYAKGCHTSLEQPPSAAMFNRETRPSKNLSHGQSDLVVSVIDKLCNALTPKQEKGKVVSLTLSPMRRAELRGTYIKQLGELRQLNENGILTEDEYEEQRGELVQLMRQLKEKD